MAKPTLYYDGACAFCRRCVERLRGATGDALAYEPSPEEHPRAVRLVLPDGGALEGAAAVFRAMAWARFPGPVFYALYRRLPPFAWASECVYRFVAGHRPFFSRLLGLR